MEYTKEEVKAIMKLPRMQACLNDWLAVGSSSPLGYIKCYEVQLMGIPVHIIALGGTLMDYKTGEYVEGYMNYVQQGLETISREWGVNPSALKLKELLNVKQRIDALHDGMYTLGQVQTKEELSGLINSFED